MGEPRFIVDMMLGNVARWLRMLGYDTLYFKNIEDWKILMLASRDGRIILTRDHGLCRRARKKGVKCLLLEQDSMEERLAYISMTIGIRLYIDLERSRCPLCNNELVKIDREIVRNRVPKRVYEKHNDFWYCRRCGKVYWIGRHWRGIEETLKKAREILSNWKQEI